MRGAVIENGVTFLSPSLRVTVAPGGSLATLISSVVPWNTNPHEQTPIEPKAQSKAPNTLANFMWLLPPLYNRNKRSHLIVFNPQLVVEALAPFSPRERMSRLVATQTSIFSGTFDSSSNATLGSSRPRARRDALRTAGTIRGLALIARRCRRCDLRDSAVEIVGPSDVGSISIDTAAAEDVHEAFLLLALLTNWGRSYRASIRQRLGVSTMFDPT